MNWEDMDLEAVKLPGAKKAEVAPPDPAKRPAKDNEVSCVLALARCQTSKLHAIRLFTVLDVEGGVIEMCYPVAGHGGHSCSCQEAEAGSRGQGRSCSS